MGVHVLPGNPPIEVILRRSRRARRITLRMSALDGRVTLTVPEGVAEDAAWDFAVAKEAWLRRHMAARPAPVRIVPGGTLPFLGEPHRLDAHQKRGIVRTEGCIALRFDDGQAGPRLAAWLKGQARVHLSAACDAFSSRLGRPYTRLTLRDTRSRWGSCSAQGGLNFSWRLVMAPKDVLEYVAAHEVAHLAQMNHSPAFWREVDALYGAHAAQRAWLKEAGSGLHAIDFGARPAA